MVPPRLQAQIPGGRRPTVNLTANASALSVLVPRDANAPCTPGTRGLAPLLGREYFLGGLADLSLASEGEGNPTSGRQANPPTSHPTWLQKVPSR